jgi:hypothetical protein
MKTLLIAALTALAITAHAADMVIPFGEVTIPEAGAQDVLAWLDTQELVIDKVVITYADNTVYTADGPIIEKNVPTSNRVRTVIAETPEEKLRRIIRALVKEHIESNVKAHKIAAARAAFEAQLKAQMESEAVELIAEEQ